MNNTIVSNQKKWFEEIFEKIISVKFEDKESIRLGRLFNTLMIISIGILIAIISIFLIIYMLKLDSPLKLLVAISFPIIFLPITIFCILQVKQQHLNFAITFYVWINFLFIALAVYLYEGVDSPGAWLLFTWTIIISGALLSPKYALKMTGLVVVFFIGLLCAKWLGIYTPLLALKPDARKIEVMSFMIITIIFSIGILTYLNMTSLKKTLKNLQEAKDELNRERSQLDQKTNELQNEIRERKIAEEEKEKMQKYLQQAQKMESIGTLAGGIAHDFNNLLTGIKGRTSLMLLNTDSSHPSYEHLKGIEDYTESASNLTMQLLGFARGGKYDVKPTDLNKLVKNQSRMFGRTRKEITIHEKYEKNLWVVEVDQSQIEQALLNLFVNAWHAMPGGGDIYIETKNIELDKKYIESYKMKQGKYAKITITDTGTGMDKKTQQRIFDPFFTTKDMGIGSGLGLASTYGIIKNHGGIINVYSEKDKGSTFNLYFPASEKKISKIKEPSKEILRGSETILIVDDEDFIIDVTRPMLEMMGYHVFTAKNGQDAIKIYKKNRQVISMVIVDLIMPNMDGGETFDRLKIINHDIKVLLSSGYGINGQATKVLERGCNGFIQKPFNIKELSIKIREILEG